MDWAAAGVLLTGMVPVALAWRANRRTSLVHATAWAAAAWLAWTATAWGETAKGQLLPIPRYLALTLTGCAAVAVLGARRPGAAAWNFVVAGLAAVLLRPLLEGRGELRLEGPHLVFLAVTLAVPLLNYLPTRLGVAALALAAGSVLQAWPLTGAALPAAPGWLGWVLVALTPWLAWLGVARPGAGGEFDQLWRSYRDRFGFVWGQRMREQFNYAAHHAGWPLRLAWGGLRTTGGGPADMGQALATLRAVLKRFAPDQ
jgi:hypothetical protein